MAETTKIEWCDRTWSPYYGCVNVSAGCDNCYADAGSGRNPAIFGKWGPVGIGNRRVAAESAWDKVLGWQREAERSGRRLSVFPSWCDPFENWDGEMVDSKGRPLYLCGNCMAPGGWSPWQPFDGGKNYECECGEAMRPATMGDVRRRFADLIRRTPDLEWLLLTKRPENAARMLAAMFGPDRSAWPTNFRVGVSIEDQATADERLSHLLALDWPNFVSYEPALGQVNFEKDCLCVTAPDEYGQWDPETNVVECNQCESTGRVGCLEDIDWLIAGGESGPGARPAHPDWFRSARDQCKAAGVPFLFKQWGEYGPCELERPGAVPLSVITPEGHHLIGGNLLSLSEDANAEIIGRFGKKRAGRTLDGVMHDEFPEPAEVSLG